MKKITHTMFSKIKLNGFYGFGIMQINTAIFKLLSVFTHAKVLLGMDANRNICISYKMNSNKTPAIS